MVNLSRFHFCRLLTLSIAPLLATGTLAQEFPDGTEAGTKQLATFRVPDGMSVDLFAAEPKLASPVAIGLDEMNRVYVAEEYRFNLGTEENRTRPFLLDDDLQLQTTDDRLKMYQKWSHKFEGGMDWFTRVSDQIRMLEDSDGDGRADRSTIFAAGFNGPLDGLAAGVMASNGDVFFTCIPHLWRLRDTNGDGVADERVSIQSGFGVNAGFLGHDLHGLCWGPDGKLYFSVGDRGFHLQTKEGMTLHGPRNGAIFRCLPDGSEMEVVMRGLRNPQEIAFDQFGNLFAADNNCDKGDHARLVFVIEGGHSGWNMAFQSIPEPYLTGPWHAEQMWHLAPQKNELTPENISRVDSPHAGSVTVDPVSSEDRPAWLLPPVGKLGAGPSGFTYYPGTGLPARYAHHFFMCNYTGNGGVESFSVTPKGAGFEIVDEHDFLKPIFATDCEFGYDGRLYVSDFVNLLWDGGTAGGRLFRVSSSEAQRDPIVSETARLVREGFATRSPESLSILLGHQDLRVRQRAQFTLAGLGNAAEPFFRDAADAKNSQLQRLHAIWGLGQLVAQDRRNRRANSGGSLHHAVSEPIDWSISAANLLVELLKDSDPEVRAQALRTLGDVRYKPAADSITALLADDNSRVRLFAALATGRIHNAEALPEIIRMIRMDADADPWLRHAGVMALVGTGDRAAVFAYATDDDRSVRQAVLLAVRLWLLESQQQWPSNADDSIPPFVPDQELVKFVASFLNDKDLSLVAEASRVINDLPLDEAASVLAGLADQLPSFNAAAVPDSLLRRILNANFRAGSPDSIQRVLAIAVNPVWPGTIRREALDALIDWVEPSPRDRVTGFWRPTDARDPAVMAACRQVLADNVMPLLETTPDELQGRLVQLISRHQLPADDAVFSSWISDASKSVATRTAALKLLAGRESAKSEESLQAALLSDQPLLRAEARDLLMQKKPDLALPLILEAAVSKSLATAEKQRAIMTLAKAQHADADKVLMELAQRLAQEELDPDLQLDVMEAGILRGLPELKTPIDQFKARQASKGLLAQYGTSVAGGDADRGRSVFSGHRVAQCLRCHKVGDQIAGGNAGPDLAQVAKKHDRMSLLQSLVEPSAKIAKGFETVTLVLQSGKTVAGLVRSEEDGSILIEQPDGMQVKVAVDDVEERTVPRSAMPEMHRALTGRELRDLVEFLSTLQ